MRKASYVVGSLAITFVLLVMATVIGVYVTHPRDEQGYVAYLQKYGRGHAKDRPELPPTAALVVEGKAACAWLGDQSPALWRTGNAHRFPAVMTRYQHATAGHRAAWGDARPDHLSVATAAWHYLCPATWQLHKPHYVFSQPGGGD